MPFFVKVPLLMPPVNCPLITKVSFAFVTVIVMVLLAVLLNVIVPENVFDVALLLSNNVAPLLRVMAFATLSEVPLNANVALFATVAVALLLPKPALLDNVNVPALTLVVPVKVFIPDKTNVPTPVLFSVMVVPLKMPDNVKTSFVALLTVMVFVPLSAILPLIVFAPFALLSKSVAPLLRVMAFTMLSEEPLNASVALPATVAVALLAPKPALFATVNVPALTVVVPVKVFVPDRMSVPVPEEFTFNVLLAEPPEMAIVEIVNVSADVTLMVSLLLAVLSKMIPPVNALPAEPLSLIVPPLFNVIAFDTLKADAPDNAKVAAFCMVTLLAPIALLFWIFNVPALMVVVPEYRFAAVNVNVPV